MKEKKYRTVIRLTCIKDWNMCDEEGYAELIKKGDPDFIEIKAYMWVGASQERLKQDQMPLHEEVKAWGMKLAELLPEYEYVAEHEPSRVILLAKKSFHKKTWINFKQFFIEQGFTEKQNLNPVMQKGFVLPVIQ